MSEFTKGPWVSSLTRSHHIDGNNVMVHWDEPPIGASIRRTFLNSEGKVVHQFIATVNPHPQLDWKANAHLIAAAPELYEALKALGDVVGDTLCWCPGHCWDCETAECIDARNAIAKAEGK